MANNELLKKLSLVPPKPGVYILKDEKGNYIYIGKARDLSRRLRFYFQERAVDPKTESLKKRISDFEYIVTNSEVDALLLEAQLVKKYQPKYNIMLKDDKRFPYIKFTNHPFPRLTVVRDRNDDGEYFGPYPAAHAMRKTIRILRALFPVRTCPDSVFKKGRVCLAYHIKRCSGPCAGKISKEDYQKLVEEAKKFLRGDVEHVLDELRKKMEEAASKLEFERAAFFRDRLLAVEKVVQRQEIVLPSNSNFDVIGYHQVENLSYVYVLEVREGKVKGHRGYFWEWKKGRGVSAQEVVRSYILNSIERVREFLVPFDMPSEPGVKIRTPSTEQEKKLIFMANQNAARTCQELFLSAVVQRGALQLLAKLLGLEQVPYRIEGVDISHFAGRNPYGAVVVFEAGMPVKREYRLYSIKSAKPGDDPASIKEVLKRRYSKAERFPDLLLIDGGVPQLNAAVDVLKELEVDVPVVSISKPDDVLHLPGKEPLVLPKNNEALKLLQRVRDEAHRFGITAQRRAAERKVIQTILQKVPGIGRKRLRNLLQVFPSLEEISKASVEELASVPGMNLEIARRLKASI